jgi:hypothetical protein
MWADLEVNKKKTKKRNSENSSDENDESESDEMSVFQQTGNFLSDTTHAKNSRTSLLPKSVIDVKLCSDANKEEPHQVEAKLKLKRKQNRKVLIFI